MQGESVHLWGIEYRSLTELGAAFGISYGSLWYWMERVGGSVEKAVRRSLSARVWYQGVQYASFSELCTAWGRHPFNVMRRLEQGWGLDEALRSPVSEWSVTGKGVTFRGVAYRSQADALKAWGIAYGFYRSQLRRLGCSVEEVMERLVLSLEELPQEGRPLLVNRLPYAVYRGVWYFRRAEFCMALGLRESEYALFTQRRSSWYPGLSLPASLACYLRDKGLKPLVNAELTFPNTERLEKKEVTV